MNKGFTLIELLLVISIVLILSVASTAFYSRFLTQNSVANSSDQIVGQLHKAQIYAMSGKQNSNWGVNFASQTITLYEGASFAGRNSAFDERFSVNNNITISGLTDLNFARITGIPPTTPTINISGNGQTKTISVNAQGGISR